MIVKMVIELELPGIDKVGGPEDDLCLHSLARSYFLHQHGDATLLRPSGLDAFESAVLETIVCDGIGEHLAQLGQVLAVTSSMVEAHP